MRRISLLLACAFGLLGLAGGVAGMRALKAEPAQVNRSSTADQQQADARKAGVWQPPSGLEQTPIWPNGAQDMADVPQSAERVEVTKAPDLVAGRPWTKAYDVTSPTMTVFPPQGKNTGASMVVFPGGGFRLLAMDLEAIFDDCFIYPQLLAEISSRFACCEIDSSKHRHISLAIVTDDLLRDS